jgi:hypothetical protein
MSIGAARIIAQALHESYRAARETNGQTKTRVDLRIDTRSGQIKSIGPDWRPGLNTGVRAYFAA